MADGVGGTLVDSVEACSWGVLHLLKDPERKIQLGKSGQERVREQFLLPRLLLNHLKLMEALVNG
jgi:trehalose synthase